MDLSARDIEVFREVGGSNGRYFKDNKNDLVNCINEIKQTAVLENKTASKIKNWKTHAQQLKSKIYNKVKTKKIYDLDQAGKKTKEIIKIQIKFQPNPNQATAADPKMAEIRKAVSSVISKR